jgi:hypothetical protein
LVGTWPHGFDTGGIAARRILGGKGASHRGATLKLVEMLAAAILVVTVLAVVAIAMGFLPSRMG